jgi:hypothetical protein
VIGIGIAVVDEVSEIENRLDKGLCGCAGGCDGGCDGGHDFLVGEVE